MDQLNNRLSKMASRLTQLEEMINQMQRDNISRHDDLKQFISASFNFFSPSSMAFNTLSTNNSPMGKYQAAPQIHTPVHQAQGQTQTQNQNQNQNNRDLQGRQNGVNNLEMTVGPGGAYLGSSAQTNDTQSPGNGNVPYHQPPPHSLARHQQIHPQQPPLVPQHHQQGPPPAAPVPQQNQHQQAHQVDQQPQQNQGQQTQNLFNSHVITHTPHNDREQHHLPHHQKPAGVQNDSHIHAPHKQDQQHSAQSASLQSDENRQQIAPPEGRDRRRTLDDEDNDDDDENVPHITIKKSLNTVEDIWREYYYGIDGNPSIRSLDAQYGRKWRRRQKDRTYFRRKRIFSFIEKYMEIYTCSESQAIRFLEDYRQDRETGRRRNLMWLYTNIPELPLKN